MKYQTLKKTERLFMMLHQSPKSHVICVTGTNDVTELIVEMTLTLEVHHKVVVNQVRM